MSSYGLKIVFEAFPGLFAGLGLGVLMATIALAAGIVLGLIGGIAATSRYKAATVPSFLYTALIRNSPILILIYIVFFGLPSVGISFNAGVSFVITLAIYAGGYMTEVFRSSLAVIPNGVIEAGVAGGLTSAQRFTFIKLPMMMRTALPSMSNYLISLFKDTAVASAIGVTELTFLTRQIVIDRFIVVEPWLVSSAMYVVACYSLAYILRRIERLVRYDV